MSKVTFPDGSLRDITPVNKSQQLNDYVAQERANGINVDTQAYGAAFDQAAAGSTNDIAPTDATTNNPLTAGLSLLFQDPGSFFSTLVSGDASSVPNNEVQTAATQPLSDVLPSLPDINLPGLPGTVITVLAIGTIAILGIAYIAHKAL